MTSRGPGRHRAAQIADGSAIAARTAPRRITYPRNVAVAVLATLAAPPVFAQDAPSGFERVELSGNDETLVCFRGGDGPPVLLLHGWPQTADEWRPVMPALSEAHEVYACDLPGVRESTNADDDFTKSGMADDLHAALTGAGIGPIHLVGHDIGLMVAYAYATAFPEDVLTLSLMDAPLPGTPAFEAIAADPRAWHFAFHMAPEVPERIVGNDVEYYVSHFIGSLWASGEPDPEVLARAADAYSDPKTLRAGFEFYRAFAQDAEDNALKAETPLPMPVLALNAGALSPEPFVLRMMEPLAEDVTGGAIEGAGHWLPEEAPEDVAERLLAHFSEVAP